MKLLTGASSLTKIKAYSKIRNATRCLLTPNLLQDLEKQLTDLSAANEELKKEISALRLQQTDRKRELAIQKITTDDAVHSSETKRFPKFAFLKHYKRAADIPLPIFLHIPKTAGTSFGQMVAANVPRENLLELYAKPRPTEGELKKLLKERETDLSMIIGHIPYSYGVHHHIQRPLLLITLLREPVDRLLSLYYYLQRQAHAQEMGQEIIEKRLDIVEFVRLSKERCLDNGQVRFLCSTDATGKPCSRALLEEAKENLHNRIGLAAITENYELLVQAMEYAFGWTRACQERYNAAENRKTVGDLDGHSVATLKEVNQYDCELFDFARTIVAKRGLDKIVTGAQVPLKTE